MKTSRRDFLSRTALGLAGAAVGSRAHAKGKTPPDMAAPVEASAPPAFGTAPAMGPAVSAATFAEAEKLVQVTMTPKEREQAARNWRSRMAALFERRPGRARSRSTDAVAPATVWNPAAAVGASCRGARPLRAQRGAAPPLPPNDDDIAFAPLTSLSRWIESQQADVGAADRASTSIASSASTRSFGASSP